MQERGASILEYVVLVTFLCLITYVATYRLFQDQAKVFCKAVTPMQVEGGQFGADVRFGKRNASSTKMECYKLSYNDFDLPVRQMLFEAGFVVIGN